MDPNENLAEQLRIAREIIERDDDAGPSENRLAELVIALHEWLARSGALPEAWGERKVEERLCNAQYFLRPAYPAPDGAPKIHTCHKPYNHEGKCSFKREKAQ